MEEQWHTFMRQAFQKWRQAVSANIRAHPNEEVMAGFLAGTLSPAEQKSVQIHLAACPACNALLTLALKAGKEEGELEPPQELIAEAKAAFDPVPEAGPLELAVRLRDFFLELVSTTGDVLVGQELIPAPVLRSRQIREFKEQLVVLKDFNDLRVELKLVSRRASFVSIYISAREKPSLEPANGLRVSLVRAEVELESYIVDSGKASFEQIEAGQYLLKIQRSGELLAQVQLDVRL